MASAPSSLPLGTAGPSCPSSGTPHKPCFPTSWPLLIFFFPPGIPFFLPSPVRSRRLEGHLLHPASLVPPLLWISTLDVTNSRAMGEALLKNTIARPSSDPHLRDKAQTGELFKAVIQGVGVRPDSRAPGAGRAPSHLLQPREHCIPHLSALSPLPPAFCSFISRP